MPLSFDQLLEKLAVAATIVNKFEGESAKSEAIRAILDTLKNSETADAIGQNKKKSDFNAIPSGLGMGGIARDIAPLKRVKTAAKRQQGYSIVPNLNLRPPGETSLRAFVEQKSPATNEERYAVIVYYLKKTIAAQKVDLDHIYSCLKELQLKVPGDLPARLRDTNRRKGWIDPSNTSDVLLTISGENFVEHDLPAKTVDAASAKGRSQATA